MKIYQQTPEARLDGSVDYLLSKIDLIVDIKEMVRAEKANSALENHLNYRT